MSIWKESVPFDTLRFWNNHDNRYLEGLSPNDFLLALNAGSKNRPYLTQSLVWDLRQSSLWVALTPYCIYTFIFHLNREIKRITDGETFDSTYRRPVCMKIWCCTMSFQNGSTRWHISVRVYVCVTMRENKTMRELARYHKVSHYFCAIWQTLISLQTVTSASSVFCQLPKLDPISKHVIHLGPVAQNIRLISCGIHVVNFGERHVQASLAREMWPIRCYLSSVGDCFVFMFT